MRNASALYGQVSPFHEMNIGQRIDALPALVVEKLDFST